MTDVSGILSAFKQYPLVRHSQAHSSVVAWHSTTHVLNVTVRNTPLPEEFRKLYDSPAVSFRCSNVGDALWVVSLHADGVLRILVISDFDVDPRRRSTQVISPSKSRFSHMCADGMSLFSAIAFDLFDAPHDQSLAAVTFDICADNIFICLGSQIVRIVWHSQQRGFNIADKQRLNNATVVSLASSRTAPFALSADGTIRMCLAS
jgi:hypothetical protein